LKTQGYDPGGAASVGVLCEITHAGKRQWAIRRIEARYVGTGQDPGSERIVRQPCRMTLWDTIDAQELVFRVRPGMQALPAGKRSHGVQVSG
jgi:hypothetical protein